MDFHKTWAEDGSQRRIEPINFGGLDPDKGTHPGIFSHFLQHGEIVNNAWSLMENFGVFEWHGIYEWVQSDADPIHINLLIHDL